ncbi:hypothetical protein BU23DRAFT_658950 [Bimuria novae-zelandiae CBS 107.79]|uniref:Uncharacterized protein n=1 Tax=Bimuria novae-zelandiae CBS 107.79 TaxID=1447943 RepID=A0A6A5V2K5_9PLEO|nr:hypothetical protein BU23DRAFT_658950 [Bimuria novae-zelandiae CBS 107.79]
MRSSRVSSNHFATIWTGTPGNGFTTRQILQSTGLPEKMLASLTDYSRNSDPETPVWDPRRESLWVRPDITDFSGPRQWLELSQIVINPLLEVLFHDSDRLSEKFAKLEITLPDHPTHSLVDPSRLSNELLDLVRPMYATQPLYKALGIYCLDNRPMHPLWVREFKVSLAPIGSVRNANGITVGELLDALDQSVNECREICVDSALRLKQNVKISHWIDDIRHCQWASRLLVALDSVAMDHTNMDLAAHVSRMLYMTQSTNRAERQGDWVGKDLMDFRKSEIGRHPITWEKHHIYCRTWLNDVDGIHQTRLDAWVKKRRHGRGIYLALLYKIKLLRWNESVSSDALYLFPTYDGHVNRVLWSKKTYLNQCCPAVSLGENIDRHHSSLVKYKKTNYISAQWFIIQL